MQNGSKLDHWKYQENWSEKSTCNMGNKVGKLRSYTSSKGLLRNPAHKKEWSKGII
jgi:hypothetical protein